MSSEIPNMTQWRALSSSSQYFLNKPIDFCTESSPSPLRILVKTSYQVLKELKCVELTFDEVLEAAIAINQ
jgi:hypothetical protein